MSSQEIFAAEAAWIYPISNSVSGQPRRVWVFGHSINRRTRQVIMNTIVFPVTAEGAPIEGDLLIKPYSRDIFATDDTPVNPANGYPIVSEQRDEESGELLTVTDALGNAIQPEQVVSQYQFFEALMAGPIHVPTLYLQTVQMCDTLGSFNQTPQI